MRTHRRDAAALPMSALPMIPGSLPRVETPAKKRNLIGVIPAT